MIPDIIFYGFMGLFMLLPIAVIISQREVLFKSKKTKEKECSL